MWVDILSHYYSVSSSYVGAQKCTKQKVNLVLH